MIDNSCKEAIHACLSRVLILGKKPGLQNRAILAQALVGTRGGCINLLISLNNPAHSIHQLPAFDQQDMVGVLKRLDDSLDRLELALHHAYGSQSAILQATVQAHRLEWHLSDFNNIFSQWQGHVEAGAGPLNCRAQVSSMNTRLDFFDSVIETVCEVAQLIEDTKT